MVLLSPWLDLQSTGGVIGKEWAGGLSLTDQRVSPGFGSLSGLPHTYVYTGTADSLEPSAIALGQAAIDQGVPMSFVIANGQIHDWVLLAPWAASCGRRSTRNSVSRPDCRSLLRCGVRQELLNHGAFGVSAGRQARPVVASGPAGMATNCPARIPTFVA